MPCELLWEKVVRMRRMANSILNFYLICFSETKQLYYLITKKLSKKLCGCVRAKEVLKV